jgi:hypothetical protein
MASCRFRDTSNCLQDGEIVLHAAKYLIRCQSDAPEASENSGASISCLHKLVPRTPHPITATPPVQLIAVETRDRHDGSNRLNKNVVRMKTFMVVDKLKV